VQDPEFKPQYCQRRQKIGREQGKGKWVIKDINIIYNPQGENAR
jgi:hypothetical protein